MTSTRIRRAPAALAALALAVGLAACGASGGDATQPAAQSQPSAQSQTPAQSQPPQSVAPAESAATGAEDCPTSAPAPLMAGETREVTIETDLGNIVIGVEADLGPLAAGNFIALAECGFYDGVIFHRIMPDFVIQGGDPTGTGSGGPGYEFPNDPVSVPYERGVVAMANAGRDTNGSQFFIVLEDAGGLPPDYSVFGRVTSGMEVADEISAGPSSGGQAGQALEPVAMNRVTVANP